ncbi:MAG: hypothetical protein ABI361_12790 [Nitrososphaera sp.]
MRRDQIIEQEMSDLAHRVMHADDSIIFSAVGHASGSLVSSSAPRHFSPQDRLTQADIEKYVFQTGINCAMQRIWEHRAGRLRYFASYYDGMMLVTVVLNEDYFLLTAIDQAGGSVDGFITKKIIPSLSKMMH